MVTLVTLRQIQHKGVRKFRRTRALLAILNYLKNHRYINQAKNSQSIRIGQMAIFQFSTGLEHGNSQITFKLDDNELLFSDFLRGLSRGLSAVMLGGGEPVRKVE